MITSSLHCSLMSGHRALWRNSIQTKNTSSLSTSIPCEKTLISFHTTIRCSTAWSTLSHLHEVLMNMNEIKTWKLFRLFLSPNTRDQEVCGNSTCNKMQLAMLRWSTPDIRSSQIHLAKWKDCYGGVWIIFCLYNIYYWLHLTFFRLSHFMELESYQC